MLVACQRDARLRTLNTTVISCEPDEHGFAVRTEDTVLYPEGGGQPADHGTIAGVPVHDVQTDTVGPWHRTSEPVPLGAAEVVVDWSRRFDHMQQHTAQHLITAVAQDRYGWATTSFHLHPLTSDAVPACDIELDAAAVGEGELRALEEAVNQAIRDNHAIAVQEVDRAAYDALEVRSRGVPEGVEQIRLVGIEGIDLNTCGGTHVAHLSELQQVVFVGTEKIRSGTRLFYLAGGRIQRRFADMLQRERQLSKTLSEGPATHVDAVKRLGARGKAANKKVKLLQLELARFIGGELFAIDQPVVPHFADSGDPAFLNAVVNHGTHGRCSVGTDISRHPASRIPQGYPGCPTPTPCVPNAGRSSTETHMRSSRSSMRGLSLNLRVIAGSPHPLAMAVKSLRIYLSNHG